MSDKQESKCKQAGHFSFLMIPHSSLITHHSSLITCYIGEFMCGIVGYVGNKQVVPLIIDGLRKLEYRGYDSAGIAVVDENHKLEIRRAEGKLRNLEEALRQQPLDGTYGLGHTRWATHGRPTEENAHPHRDCTGRVVVVH